MEIYQIQRVTQRHHRKEGRDQHPKVVADKEGEGEETGAVRNEEIIGAIFPKLIILYELNQYQNSGKYVVSLGEIQYTTFGDQYTNTGSEGMTVVNTPSSLP